MHSCFRDVSYLIGKLDSYIFEVPLIEIDINSKFANLEKLSGRESRVMMKRI